MTRSILALGSNLGDRRAYLSDAIASLPDLVAVSNVYETEPVGGPLRQGPYLNMVAVLDTDLSPKDLLGLCHRLEAAAYRVREEHWGPRTLDVDIIWVDGVEMDDPNLTLPHPRWKDRRFVLVPMQEVAPDLVSDRDIETADGRVWLAEGLA
ncbi:MAG: 2-amino-4-hydroxy-6-hydroxymethyldihydropteridine diphosphokinase [Microthrixaceae bacterium]|nr:2-amino-4-hydroxy-6-hydroxymethyldihydropteridine diphosphokinase [Microthrixaceae bacterium]MCO5311406.1 2-amino-4-hydroxy-6-hydroxymethyldihydropteridine diphosphokinase [Microthrixaceae bacterium]HPB44330.1 2-amino-4-hydroxy-6-hydroxymethyldihydropteridine diphosphokinase [Microthrixaceae bacterium]